MRKFAVKSLKLKNSIIIISVILPMLVGFLAYDLYRQSNTLRDALLERGIILAQTGAATSGKIMSDAIAHGVMEEEQVFDTNYVPTTNKGKLHKNIEPCLIPLQIQIWVRCKTGF